MSNAKITIQNCYSWLTTDDDKIRNILHQSLRFREKNYFHSRLFKQRLWDGFSEYFKKDSGKFLTGLLPEIEEALKILNVNYKVDDQREKFNFIYDEVKDDFLQQFIKDVKMRDYQSSYINNIIKHKRGLVSAKTGAGKTYIMIGMLKCLPENCPTLILSNTTSVVDQNYKEIEKWGIEKVGRVYGKYFEPNVITCANVQSLHKLEKLIPYVKVMIVDEIHAMMSKVPKSWYNKMKNCVVRIGLSATPFKFGGSDKCHKYSVKGYFGPILKIESDHAEDGLVTTKKLQEAGILSSSQCTFYPINEPDLKYAIYQDAVTHGIANNWQFHEIVKNLVIKKCAGRTLIIVERIAHGDALAALIPGSLWVQGKDSLETRGFVIDQLQRGKGNIVGIATNKIFDAGINIFVNNLLNAASGKAEHIISQRLGRGLRPADDKENLNYYDFYFKNNEYLETHSEERVKILMKEGHKVEIKEELDF